MLDMNTKAIESFPFLESYRPEQGARGGFRLDKDEIPEETRDKAGVYIIETTNGFHFPYPEGKSNVIYIGESENLMVRFKEHRKTLMKLKENSEYGMKPKEPWISSRYQYMLRKGARVFYYTRRGNQEAKEMEAEVIWRFYEMYRALPVGNSAKSYSRK